VPVSAVLANCSRQLFRPGDQGGTYNGNPLMVAVAQGVFAVVSQPAFLAQVRALGDYLAHACRLGKAICAGGCMSATASVSYRLVFARGFVAECGAPHILRFMPSLRVSLRRDRRNGALAQCRTQ